MLGNRRAPIMEKRYYTAGTLEEELRGYERRFGIGSATFVAAHRAGRAPDAVDPFDRTVWADTYWTLCQLRASSATGELQPAG